jgi:ferredoxin
MVLTIGTGEILLRGVFPAFGFDRFLPAPIYGLFLLSQELFAGLVLAAVGVLLYRRLVVKPKRLQGDKVHSGDAVFILSMIAALMITLLVTAAFERVIEPRHPMALQPFSSALAAIAGGVAPGTAAAIARVSGWAHAILVLVFLNYLPYSKHLHVITSLPNHVLLQHQWAGQVGVMRPMDLEAEGVEQFGAADVQDLTWKNLLDGYSCTECGRCTAACPANITGKVLSPRKIIVNTRQRTMELAPLSPAIAPKSRIRHCRRRRRGRGSCDSHGTSAPTASSTTTSPRKSSGSARLSRVRSGVSGLDRPARRHQSAPARSWCSPSPAFPEEIQPAFEALERNGAPWKFQPPIARAGPTGSCDDHGRVAERGERPDVLFWVGCMGSFDDRAKKIAVAFARILHGVGIKFAILGQEESCNGDPARRMGNEYLYQMLADRPSRRSIATR